MPEERIFRDEESLTPDAIAADKKAESMIRLPPFAFALTEISSRFGSGIN